MADHWVRGAGRAAGALLLAGAVVAAAGGCSSSDAGKASSAASKAASAAASAGAGVLASASAKAKEQLDKAKDGVNAKDQVKLGAVAIGGDGRATAKVSATNTADAAKSFAVQVNFTDKDGNVLDTVAVTLSDVAAKKTGDATARSNRKLTGSVHAAVARALRY
ncbi:hypothetical protein BIV57_00030 [Mangrovactinospora gilvigrisea]|uniref:Lipoprotein n=1 Tax=Mangrovactinospora gilvigrisea TaxID=1428644 RepID=A0A1J7CIS5_9ACTN|nr:hypothetical protein [Mangrovactinospora gilvigrisea]OIV39538.1 hypothetical protein BIV57_00030 [Mangrovactinospora gilvigrisea]